MLVWRRRAIGQSSHTRMSCRESELSVEIKFCQNSWPYIVLKLTCEPHAMLVFYWSRLTPTHCLLFIGHCVHPRNACFSLAMVYTGTILVLHWSQLTPMHFLVSANHFVDFIYGQMYLSTTSAGFFAGQGDILHENTTLISSLFAFWVILVWFDFMVHQPP